MKRDELTVQHTNPHDWVESSVDIKQAGNRVFLGVTISRRTRITSLCCIYAVLGIFFVRAIQLQAVQGSMFAGLSEQNKIREYWIPAKRGTISDRNGKRLVSNAPRFVVRLYPHEIVKQKQEREQLLDTLSSILAVSPKTLSELVAQAVASGTPVLLRENIPRLDALRMAIALADMKGIEIAIEEFRRYEFDSVLSLSHIIGYMGRITKQEYDHLSDLYQFTDSIGKDGIELVYEQALRGTFGVKKVEIDARGFERSVLAQNNAVDGKNIVLSIDYAVQKKAEQSLAAVLKKFGKKRGVVIVSQPKIGEIVALVSIPSYDNNIFARGIAFDEYQKLVDDSTLPLFSRANKGEYPSGSTIKMIIAASALQEGVITGATNITSSGGIHIGKWFFPDWKAGGHGRTNLSKALSESVNTYFYTIAGGYQSFKGLGIDRVVEYLKKMGLGTKTGIDLPSESNGFVPDPAWKEKSKHEPWYIGDTYHLSIGQGDSIVTPLQVHAYTNYFANSGISYVPRLVQEPGARTVLRSGIFRKEVIEMVRAGLREGVLSGSSRRLSLLPVSAAGKTGTAQWSKDRPAHAWFTGWAPYENPAIAITVLIEEGEEGSRTAVVVAHDILQWYFKTRHPER